MSRFRAVRCLTRAWVMYGFYRGFGNGRLQSLVKAAWNASGGRAYLYPQRWLA